MSFKKLSVCLVCLCAFLLATLLAADAPAAAPLSQDELLGQIFAPVSAPEAEGVAEISQLLNPSWINCSSYCQQYGRPCTTTGGRCGYTCDDFGNCDCGCYYP